MKTIVDVNSVEKRYGSITLFHGSIIGIMLAMSAAFVITACVICHNLADGIERMEV